MLESLYRYYINSCKLKTANVFMKSSREKSLWLICTMEYLIRIRLLKVNNFDYKVRNSHENHIEWNKPEKKM